MTKIPLRALPHLRPLLCQKASPKGILDILSLFSELERASGYFCKSILPHSRKSDSSARYGLASPFVATGLRAHQKRLKTPSSIASYSSHTMQTKSLFFALVIFLSCAMVSNTFYYHVTPFAQDYPRRLQSVPTRAMFSKPRRSSSRSSPPPHSSLPRLKWSP